MTIMNSRRHLLSCAVLSCLFLGASAFAQDRPITHGVKSASRTMSGGGQVKPNRMFSQLARVDAAGRENIHFGWIGSVEPGEGHYYRIHGPTFVIEYDNASGNHSHTVWRDLEKDFGEDLLLKHYEQNHVPQEHR